MASRATIANIISAMKAAYPNYNPDPAKTPEMFLAGLQDLPDDLVTAASQSKIFESGRAFAPSVGEIRGEAFRLQAQAAGIPDAWQAYEEAINKPTKGEKCGEFQRLLDGSYGYPRKPVEWSHPLVERVAYLMGWPKSFPSQEAGIDRAHFIKAYEAEQGRLLSYASQLPMVRQYVEARRIELQGNPTMGFLATVAKMLDRKST